jgi:hypothetical protein
MTGCGQNPHLTLHHLSLGRVCSFLAAPSPSPLPTDAYYFGLSAPEPNMTVTCGDAVSRSSKPGYRRCRPDQTAPGDDSDSSSRSRWRRVPVTREVEDGPFAGCVGAEGSNGSLGASFPDRKKAAAVEAAGRCNPG